MLTVSAEAPIITSGEISEAESDGGCIESDLKSDAGLDVVYIAKTLIRRQDVRLDPDHKFGPWFVAPSTLPTMLYRLLKNVNQSLRTFLCSSERSSQSGLASSALSDDWASAREASLPVKTVHSLTSIHVELSMYSD